ncbi:MAG: ComEC/Rec2 family competence protein [Bacteroidetes bacterium]|nr:ComEC/Rec2 family competence protein [Bacteroidota bacterium]
MSGSGTFKSAWLRAPMLRAALPFIGGLLVGRSGTLPVPVAWGMVIAGAAAWVFLAYRRTDFAHRWWRGAALVPMLFAFGLLWQRLHTPEEHVDDVARYPEADGWRAAVLEVASSNARTVRLWTRADAAFIAGKARPVSGRLLLTLLLDSAGPVPAIGDRLLVDAAALPLQRVPDPGGFDQAAWARSYGVTHGCFAPAGRWRIAERASGWAAWFEGARRQVSAWLVRSGLPDRERALAKAVLLGLRDELDADQRAAFARSGTMHVLAVSGSHVGLIYAAFLWGLAFLGRKPGARWGRGLLILAALWAYAGLTGLTPSVLRATVTFSVFTLAEMLRRRTEPLNSLALSAFVLLLWDPGMLVQLGFQLSFLAVLGIALFYRPLVQAWTPPHAVAAFFWSLFAVSLAAQAFATPLSLLVFQAFPTWFLPANMVIVGLVSLGVYGGALLVAVHAVPVLGPLMTFALEALLRLLGGASAFFADAPGAYPAVRIDAAQCLGLYALLLLLAAWWFQRWWWARQGGLVVLLALLLSWGWSARVHRDQRQFVVYDDRKALACAFVEGRSMAVFAERPDAYLVRRVEQHRRAVGVEHVVRVDSIPGRVDAQGTCLLFFSDGLPPTVPADPAVTTVCIVRGGSPAGTFGEGRPPGMLQVVLAPGIRGRQREAWRRWCAAEGVPLHDVRADGAYVRCDDRGDRPVAARGR